MLLPTSPLVQTPSAMLNTILQVYTEALDTSKDELFRKALPPALEEVKIGSEALLEANKLAASDPFSKQNKMKAIDGSAGNYGQSPSSDLQWQNVSCGQLGGMSSSIPPNSH